MGLNDLLYARFINKTLMILPNIFLTLMTWLVPIDISPFSMKAQFIHMVP